MLASLLLNKVAVLQHETLDSDIVVFSLVNFVKFLRTRFLQNTRTVPEMKAHESTHNKVKFIFLKRMQCSCYMIKYDQFAYLWHKSRLL